jgi:hypothetical protein
MSFISIGQVVLVGFGGEAFTAYGKAMRELCPDKFVISAVCTNGYAGYFPTAEAFEQGGYEACSSFFLPTVEQVQLIVLGLRDGRNEATRRL